MSAAPPPPPRHVFHDRITLPFHDECIRELEKEDGLVVLGKGLGERKLILRLLYDRLAREKSATTAAHDKRGIILLVNAMDQVANIAAGLKALGVTEEEDLPKVVTSETTTLSAKRWAMYERGGIFAPTSRILVTDLLNDNVPISQVECLILRRAHQISENSNEAFILRLIAAKQRAAESSSLPSRRRCAVKAFSDSPEELSGYSRLSNAMRYLGVRKVYLWPRFRKQVRETLDEGGEGVAESRVMVVKEYRQPLSPAMREIQAAAIETMDACVDELKRTAGVDVKNVSVENNLTRNLQRQLRTQLDPIWHRVSNKAKGLVADLGTLRKILNDLLVCDCVTFYERLLDYKAQSKDEDALPALWLVSDSADRIFRHAKARLYTLDLKTPSLRVALEPTLKPILLKRVLGEIAERREEEVRKKRAQRGGTETGSDEDDDEELMGGNGILVVVRDESAAVFLGIQIEDQSMSPSFAPNQRSGTQLERRFRRFLMKTEGFSDKTESGEDGVVAVGEDEEEEEEEEESGPQQKSSSSFVSPPSTSTATNSTSVEKELLRRYFFAKPPVDPTPTSAPPQMAQVRLASRYDTVTIVTAAKLMDEGLLEERRPRYVILYDAVVGALRETELYHATYPTARLDVFLLYYSDSLDEQRYLLSLNAERDAFLDLIRQKSTLVLPEMGPGEQLMDSVTSKGGMGLNGEGGAEGIISPQLVFASAAGSSSSSEVLGSTTTGTSRHQLPPTRTAVLDTRELRSALPHMLFSNGYRLDVRTLQVGDYVLSPEICLERKSLQDLFQSFASGRLYTQVKQMSRHYTRPGLLIEFAESATFELVPALSDDVSPSSVITKLCLLTMHFPELRVFWSKSPRFTVEVFKELQRNQRPPDGDRAAALEAGAGVGGGEDDDEAKRDSSGGVEKKKKKKKNRTGANAPAHNAAALELLRKLPGVTPDNMVRLARRGKTLAGIARATLPQLTEWMNNPNNAVLLFEFLHRSANEEREGTRKKKGAPRR